ncbi:GNAT family N-acetyltransferase [Nonomuraea sp. LPB2021202275-12-8]|uniref:GNAT family N-acetyltransferase n=1 Tax=Nonomuraea sp. LPB2021202275-12-8 TaxID=3120159 RepID=UPI00300CA80B
MIAIRELHEIGEFEQVMALFENIWHFDPGRQPITVELMLALAHAGNYVAGAFDGDRMVGASVAFFAAGSALHSHITGVAGAPGAGLALKLHQRQWALDRGLARVTWTFDPLVRRNAHFNLAKLGARPHEYLPAFYGVMDDAINQGDESDRVLAVWPLTAPRVEALVRRGPVPVAVPASAVVALADEDGWPVPGPRTDAPAVLVAVPEDVERLRHADPGTAKAWRHAVREILGGMLADGGKITGFHDKSFYVVERT